MKEIEYLTDTDRIYQEEDQTQFCGAWVKSWGQNESSYQQHWQILRRKILQDWKKKVHYNLSIDGEPVILQISEVEITSEDIPGWTVANKGCSDCSSGYYNYP